MKREDALKLINEYIKNDKMIAHCLASEAVMRTLANQLNEDEGKWGIAGLLHDLDVEMTNYDMNIHGLETEKILKEKGLDDETIEAIKLHNEEAKHGQSRTTIFQHALAAAETITGLIFATTLVYQDKKLNSVKPKSVIKRMKEKHFAASVKRDNIMECEKLGFSVNEFAELALNSMKKIAPQIGF